MKMTTLALAALSFVALPARADDQLPTDVRGQWCEVRKLANTDVWLYRREPRCPDERRFVVTATGFEDGGAWRCSVIAVERTVMSRCVSTTDATEWVLNESSFKRRGARLAVKFDEP